MILSIDALNKNDYIRMLSQKKQVVKMWLLTLSLNVNKETPGSRNEIPLIQIIFINCTYPA